MPKIVMVTDQPFWRAASGPHQRIFSLFKFLESEGFELVVFFMVDRSADDLRQCETLNARFVPYEPSPGWLGKSINSLLKKFKRSDSNVDDEHHETQGLNRNRSLSLNDYEWPHADTQFAELLNKEKPHVIIVEYLVWSYLIKSIETMTDRPRTILDTHDALYVRNEHFKQHGKTHWLDIDSEQESRELQRYDLVLSIQEQERILFQEMAPDSEHLVVGHVPWYSPLGPIQRNENDPVRFGFIGSANEANVDGIVWFISSCWPLIKSQSRALIELFIGGPIRESIVEQIGSECLDSDSQIIFAGQIQSVREFYQTVDVVLNPVRFGSGLKIKSVEALSFHKPLVATSHSITGFPTVAREVVFVADSEVDFAASCLRLADNRETRSVASDQAKRIAQSVFSPQNVYSDLSNWIKRQSATFPT